MPIYEYRCNSCRRVTGILVRSISSEFSPRCPRCSSTDVRKLVSRFAVLKSDDSRLDDLADPSRFGDVDENDPRSVARWAKRMGRELGEDLGEDFDEAIEQMESGEMPEDGDGVESGPPGISSASLDDAGS